MKIAAFDLSLTCTGFALPSQSGTLAPKSTIRGVDRLRWIRDAVVMRALGCDLVVLEGYSFASRGRAIISLGELGGVVRLAIADAGLPYVDVPPASRAKIATGKGNAPKEAVLVAAVTRLGYAGHSHDEADALWLRVLAHVHYGLGAPELPKAHLEASSGVDWPAFPAK